MSEIVEELQSLKVHDQKLYDLVGTNNREDRDRSRAERLNSALPGHNTLHSVPILRSIGGLFLLISSFFLLFFSLFMLLLNNALCSSAFLPQVYCPQLNKFASAGENGVRVVEMGESKEIRQRTWSSTQRTASP